MQDLLNSYEEGKNLTLLETYIKKCGDTVESFVEKRSFVRVSKKNDVPLSLMWKNFYARG